MEDSQILSSFGELSRPPGVAPMPAPLVFDACQVGVMLRAVLFVAAVIGLGTMFGASAPLEWFTRLVLLSGAVLPATLVWLLAACSMKRLLARVSIPAQYLAGVSLGALAGGYAVAMLALLGLLEPAPWLAGGCTGAAIAAVLVAALVLRARARAPAAAAARLAELQSRIRPHFLFNTLNSAVALVRAEPAKAESLLEDLSDLFRHALVDQGEAVSLEQEVALARRYLGIEQVRFGERLQIEWSIDPAANQARLPPLLLQPLVENAVRHGVEPSAGGAEVRISTLRRGSRVVIKVTNTLPAGPGARGHGLALQNVRDRLYLLHDLQGQFRSVHRDGLFQVRIEVPA